MSSTSDSQMYTSPGCNPELEQWVQSHCAHSGRLTQPQRELTLQGLDSYIPLKALSLAWKHPMRHCTLDFLQDLFLGQGCRKKVG